MGLREWVKAGPSRTFLNRTDVPVPVDGLTAYVHMADNSIRADCDLCQDPMELAASQCTADVAHLLCAKCTGAYNAAYQLYRDHSAVLLCPICLAPLGDVTLLADTGQPYAVEMCADSTLKDFDEREINILEKSSDSAPKVSLRLLKMGDPVDEATIQIVADLFNETLDATRIQKVFEVSNPAMLGMYLLCRDRMISIGREPNETMCFHATPRQNIGSIIRNGFDIRRSGSKHGQALGPGIYMASTAKFASRYGYNDLNNNNCMFVCRSLLGKSGKDTLDDSRSSGGANPEQYVLRREQQVYPAYVVYYSGAAS